ncbi:hypothetical protein [Nocardia blacklockiae]|uniref:hypothetical protein n=1 Tax=Nocardia blacklockiae TaxID=480036 RepID=UPI00189639D7|nr:hypothetical protein [Nocardia blacklockiae]MBF6170985.1 hypothetical protein [Nocardia blacklockiae]
MITPIEIKVDLAGEVAETVFRLGCAGRPVIRRRVWFAETRSPGACPELLANRIIIRLRSGARDDLTVKLRPCDAAQLVGRWTEPFDAAGLRYRIEGEWSARRRVLAASAVSERPAGSLWAAAAPGADVAAALDSAQRQFLVSCTPPGVAVDHLGALGPIASTKWPDVRIGDAVADVERWQVGDLDLLELSVRVTPRPGEAREDLDLRAAAAKQRIESAARRLGLRISQGANKTEQALVALLGKRAGSTDSR